MAHDHIISYISMAVAALFSAMFVMCDDGQSRCQTQASWAALPSGFLEPPAVVLTAKLKDDGGTFLVHQLRNQADITEATAAGSASVSSVNPRS